MPELKEEHFEVHTSNRARAYERKQKYEAIVNMVVRWLDSNIDEYNNEVSSSPQIEIKNAIAQDSADLKEKILLALDDKTTIREIKDGDF
jgi:hypothetical protein